MHALPHPATPNPAASLGVILRTRAALRLDRLLARLAAGPLPPPKPRAHNHSGPHHKPAFPTTRA